jgi:hypothetical protein
MANITPHTVQILESRYSLQRDIAAELLRMIYEEFHRIRPSVLNTRKFANSRVFLLYGISEQGNEPEVFRSFIFDKWAVT